MLALRLVLVGAFCLASGVAMARPTPEAADRSAKSAAAPLVVAAQQCPAGYHWEGGHYAKHGKWRDAGCWPN